MSRLRYVLLALTALSFTPAAAQPDSVHVVVGGFEYPAYIGSVGPTLSDTLGPLPLVQAEPFDACTPIQNSAELEGNIAFITRGACSSDSKIVHANEAGALAAVIMNNDAEHPDRIIVMGSTWPPVSIPNMMVSYNSGQTLLDALPTEATLVPVRVAYVPTAGFLSTGAVETALFDNGFVGSSLGFLGGPGFTFNGEQGLHIGSLLLGRVVDGDTVVAGTPYGPPEYEAVESVRSLAPPFPPPFAAFDEAYETAFASDTLGVEVTARAYARTGDAFVVFDYTLRSTTGAEIEGLYAGLFADLDVGFPADDLGGFDAETGLAYAYDSTGTSPTYFGVAALGDVSGWALGADLSSFEAFDRSLYHALTTAGVAPDTTSDVLAIVGTGPLDIGAESGGEPSAEPVRVRFALVAGADEAEILANARAARQALGVSNEAATAAGRYALDPAYPNPFRSSTTLTYALPVAGPVRLAVYDVLGREVAVLVEGVVPAGVQSATLDATNLPSGVYVVRLEAGGARLDRRLTLIR